jgi:hypothetical protein
VARANPAILAVVLVSIIMNMFAFSYSALIAPIGLDVYRVSPILVGALAAAEPLGAIAIGIPLSTGWLRLEGRRALLRGSLLFMIGLAAMALSPWYALAFVLLLIGGLGTAAFSNMQTTLILIEAPPGAIARDGDRDHVHRHRPGRCYDDRHPLRTSRTSEGDPYHDRPGGLRIESRLEETDQSAGRPIVMTPTICMLEGDNPACHSQRHRPTRLVISAGFTKSGLPLYLLLVCQPFGEALLYRVAQFYEVATGWMECHSRRAFRRI